jgi:hypothetical protein
LLEKGSDAVAENKDDDRVEPEKGHLHQKLHDGQGRQ